MRDPQLCRLHAGDPGSYTWPDAANACGQCAASLWDRPSTAAHSVGDIRPDGSANASGRDSHSDGSASAGNRGAA